MKKWKRGALALLAAASLLISGCGAEEAAGTTDADRATETVTEAISGAADVQEAVDDLTEAVSEAADTESQAGADTETDGEPESDSLAVSLQTADYGEQNITLENIPEFSGEAYVVLNGNMPAFSDADFSDDSYETYSELDELGRCGAATANIGSDLMPTEERGSISQVKPSGWHSVQYDCVDGGSLYNRCHLIGYQLTAENANERNLITGTRFLNVEGMLPFENMVADYIDETDNHVLYRVTPIFEGNNLVADGVEMEGWSVEDEGDGICFHVYAYNCQPGIVIDYATGESYEDEDYEEASEASVRSENVGSASDSAESDAGAAESAQGTYVLNTNTKKFHRPDCGSVSQMNESNKVYSTKTRDEIIADGYDPCGNCNP